MTWKRLLNGNLVKVEGNVHVVKHESSEIVPLGCSVCRFLYRTREDEFSHREFDCCERCSTVFARPNIQAWRSGWRPSSHDVQVDIERRSKLTVNIK